MNEKIITLCLAQAFMIMPLSYAMPVDMENLPPEIQAQVQALQKHIDNEKNQTIPAEQGDKQEEKEQDMN